MRLVIYGNPITKKNSQRLVYNKGTGRTIPIPSRQYSVYEREAIAQIHDVIPDALMIDKPVNVKCVYFMGTHHRVDLCNLLEATSDVLVRAGLLKDDNSEIIKSYDGSRVAHDKELARVEIDITEVEYA